MGVSVEKARLLMDQPTQIAETRSAAEIAKALCAKAGIAYDPTEPLPQTLRRLGVNRLAERAEAGRPTAEVITVEAEEDPE